MPLECFAVTTPTAVWMAILIMAWAVSCHRPSLLAYIYLGMLASLCLPVFWSLRKLLPGSFRPDSANFGPLLRYGLPCVMTTLPQVLNLRMDQMLMAAFLPPGVLGLYVVAVAWSGAINPLLNAVATVLFPEVASKESERERNATFIRGTLGGRVAFSAGWFRADARHPLGNRRPLRRQVAWRCRPD